MIKIFIAILLINISVYTQTTYYVSYSEGKDSNPGTTQSLPFKTIDKVNSIKLIPGDKILFKKGETWMGKRLIINASGTDNAQITISSYGTSNIKPIISLKSPIPNWDISSNWTYNGNNIWHIQLPFENQNNPIDRLWLNGNEEYYGCGSTDGDGKPATNGDGTSGINSSWKFIAGGNGILYIYSNSNPATSFSSMEYAGGNPGDYTISVLGDYIVLDGIDVQGGMRGSVGLCGADNAVIKNCNIGKYSNWVGIEGNSSSYLSSDKTSDYCIIENDTIYSAWKYKYYYYTARTPYGIYIGNGANNWVVKNNFIKDWWMNIFGNASSGGTTQNCLIENNEITSPDFTYAKGWQVATGPNPNENMSKTRWIFRNNYIHDLKACGIQLGTGGNFVYGNIIANITLSQNSHAAEAVGIEIFPDYSPNNCDSNFVFNNTIFNIKKYGTIEFGNHTRWYNNALINTGTSLYPPISIVAANSSNDIYSNNLYFSEGANQSTTMFNINGIKSVNLTDWLGLNSSYSLSIKNEKLFVGNLSSLINLLDFSLPDGSVAINAGKDISSLVPAGLTDRYGNIINLRQPNIGAIAKSLLDQSQLKIYLEGPYKDGKMSTYLNEDGYIPKYQPYNTAPWNYNGTEYISNLTSNVVDWVLVELRRNTSSSSIAAVKAALLNSNGNITSTDGITPLKFDTSLTGSYYVVIKHRNHLAVMSSIPVQLKNSSIQFDFTTSESKAFGQNSLVKLDNGVYGMFGGDMDGNGTIEKQDIIGISQKLFSTGYLEEDADMKPPVNVLDYKFPNLNMSKSTNTP